MRAIPVGAALLFAACGLAASAAWAQSDRIVLITEAESTLESPPAGDLTFRAGISRGPSITVISPKPSDTNLKSPIHLQLKFEGRGGAQVDADSLKLTYAKKQAVDLTARVKAFVKPAGVDLPSAEVPPGTHTIRAEIKDKDGRAGFTSFVIKVVK